MFYCYQYSVLLSVWQEQKVRQHKNKSADTRIFRKMLQKQEKKIMQNVQYTKDACEKIVSVVGGIHEKRQNLLTSRKSMIKSNPSIFAG